MVLRSCEISHYQAVVFFIGIMEYGAMFNVEKKLFSALGYGGGNSTSAEEFLQIPATLP